VVSATILWLIWRTPDKAWLKTLRPFAGLLYALALIAPWFVSITLASHGQFLEQSAGHDMFAKIWQGQNRGMLPPGLYLLAFLVSFFPFSLPAMLAAPDAWRHRADPAVKFCLGWIIPCWIVFELSLTKLPHYVMPMYPAIALLAAKALREGYPTLQEFTRRWPLVMIVALWVMIGAALATTGILLPQIVDGTWSPLQIGAGIALVTLQTLALVLLARPAYRQHSLVVLAAGALLFNAISFGITLPNLRHLWLSADVVRAANYVKPCGDMRLVTTAYNEPSLIFLAGTDTLVRTDGAQARAELEHDPCRIAIVDDKRLTPFLQNAHTPPRLMGSVRAYNLGHGDWRNLYLYLSPSASKEHSSP